MSGRPKNRGSIASRGKVLYLFVRSVQPGSGLLPALYATGMEAISLRIKRPGRAGDYSI